MATRCCAGRASCSGSTTQPRPPAAPSPTPAAQVPPHSAPSTDCTYCEGNKNNFASEAECLTECKPGQPGPLPSILQSLSLVREDYQVSTLHLILYSTLLLGRPAGAGCPPGPPGPPARSPAAAAGPRSIGRWCSTRTRAAGAVRAASAEITLFCRPCPAKLARRKKCKQAACSSWAGPWQQNQDN